MTLMTLHDTVFPLESVGSFESYVLYREPSVMQCHSVIDIGEPYHPQ
jgi:hypothetical protein